jgi:phage gpG-like protein
MQIGINFTGLTQFQNKIKTRPQFAESAALLAMKAVIKKIETDIKKDINIRGTIPSLPGEPPHKVTGNLYSNVYSRAEKTGNMTITGIIGDTAEYAAYLEYGTSRMAPRPYFRINIDRNTQMFENLMKGILGKI